MDRNKLRSNIDCPKLNQNCWRDYENFKTFWKSKKITNIVKNSKKIIELIQNEGNTKHSSTIRDYMYCRDIRLIDLTNTHLYIRDTSKGNVERIIPQAEKYKPIETIFTEISKIAVANSSEIILITDKIPYEILLNQHNDIKCIW